MINWTMLAANSLWIVGLSVLLAAFSYRSYQRRLVGTRRSAARRPQQADGVDPYLRLGLVLFTLGQLAVSALGGEAWWRILLWALLLGLLLVEPALALWTRREELLARLGGERSDRPAPDPRALSDRWKVAAVVAVALVQGLIYLYTLPPWQHYDEPSHFEVAWLLAHTDAPAVTAQDREMLFVRETAASMLAHDFYWNLSKPALLTDRTYPLGFPQFDNRPLYYRLAAIPLRLFSHLDLVSQLYLARMVSLLFFLLTILSAAGVMGSLLVPGHALRWAVPLCLALLPPFADIMTAVNNDAGAFALFTLFLWGSVIMIRRGISLERAVWVVGAGLLAFIMKNTALISLPLIPVAFLLAGWRQMGWRWRWLGLGLGGVGLLGLLLSLQWSDARYWYHWDAWGTRPIQAAPSRHIVAATTLDAAVSPVLGEYAVGVTVDPAAAYHQLLNPLPAQALAEMAGQTVTVGGWFWIEKGLDAPLTVAGPKLLWSESGTQSFGSNTDPILVTTTPTFHAATVEIPPGAGVVYFALLGNPGQGEVSQPIQLYLDGAVVALGEYPTDQVPAFANSQAQAGMWGGQPFSNLLRNGSGAAVWPRVHPWVEGLAFRAAERSPTVILNGLMDWQRTGRLLTVTVPQHLISGLLGYFAWGHVRLQGAFWLPLYWTVLALALAGSGWWGVRVARQQLKSSQRRGTAAVARAAGGESHHRRRRRGQGVDGAVPGVIFLGISGLLVWTNGVLWVLTFIWVARFGMPSSRYIMPAALPTVLLVVAGVAALAAANRRVQGWVIYAVVAAFALLNLVALATINHFYGSLPL